MKTEEILIIVGVLAALWLFWPSQGGNGVPPPSRSVPPGPGRLRGYGSGSMIALPVRGAGGGGDRRRIMRGGVPSSLWM